MIESGSMQSSANTNAARRFCLRLSMVIPSFVDEQRIAHHLIKRQHLFIKHSKLFRNVLAQARVCSFACCIHLAVFGWLCFKRGCVNLAVSLADL